VTTNKYFIDASTLSVGSDRIVRYVLVVRTSGGASNVSFEGINCKELTWKHYATGRSDGTWTKSRAARTEWRPIENKRSIAPCRIESGLFLSGRHRHQYRRRRAQRLRLACIPIQTHGFETRGTPMIDALIPEFDKALRAVFAPAPTRRPMPGHRPARGRNER
jgi:hypothetical protein